MFEVPLLHVEAHINIAAPPADVWAVAGNFSDLTWVPAVQKSRSTLGNAIGSVRTLDFGGPILTEELVAYDASERSYTYRILDTEANRAFAPITDVEAMISVGPDGSAGSVATWTANFRRADHGPHPAAGKDDAAAQAQMSATVTAGLAGLRQRVEAG